MCDTPHFVDNKKWPHVLGEPRLLPVPCGRCPVCQRRRVANWSHRLMQEQRVSNSSFFVTLTYDTRYVPISDNGFMTLKKRDVQLWMKRLRKAHPKDVRLKYYLAGEYGDTNWRPHYHVILFNAELDLIHEAWQLGEVHVGRVEEASVQYTAKYINKGKRIPQHSRDDRLPEFSLMSKGLGKNYLSPAMVKYHRASVDRNYVTTAGGARFPLSRYYRDRIWNEDERLQQVKHIRRTLENQAVIDERRFRLLYPDGDYDRYLDDCKAGRYFSHHREGDSRKL